MGCDIDRRDIRKRAWISQAISLVEADANRSADTHLLRIPLPPEWNVHIYLKDESTHPTGSLKHRLARSLFLYALCNGWIDRDTTIIDASSGSTAISEAYFAALLGLKFIAVVPRSTAAKKVENVTSSRSQHSSTKRRPCWPPSCVVAILISSRTQSERLIGAGIIISLSRFFSRWSKNDIPFQPGLLLVPARAEQAPQLVGTSGIKS
jgi:hypothetical protein